MPVSSSTEHWIRPDALTINLNHFGDPDYLQVSVLAGAVVMAFKQDVIGYNAAHNYRTWPLEAANTYLETTSAYNVYARLTRSEVNARALVVYDTVLRDIEGREITYAEDGSEVLGDANPDFFFAFLGQISASVNSVGGSIQREWVSSILFGTLNTNQFQNTESGGEWVKMFRLNKVTDMIDVLKTFSSAVFQKYFVREKPVTDIKRSIDSDELVPVSDESLTTSKYVEKKLEGIEGKYLRKDQDDRSTGTISSDKGMEVGHFIQGMLGGSGAKMYMDENGKVIVEADKAYFREEMLVPKITFNSIDVVSGEMAQTFAYGTIKSVDTATQIATLDLLDDEYGTLHVYDKLRGTFHRLEGGNNTEYSKDKNGFHNYSGFSTSYFTPTEILVNEKGHMEFRYALQDADGVHPCAGMNFFAYANPFEKERQSITYQTREYTRRLKNMTGWAIVPSDNIAMQVGNLNDLEIGNFKMSGWGTFETNSYLIGTQIQFSPDQLEELKGLNGVDAYSVTLSSYDGVIKVDATGTKITSGMTSEFNVVTGSMNVVTGENNVIVADFRLKTIIQVSKGNTPLYFSPNMEAGSYMATVSPVGCVAEVSSGVVTVTEITDLKNCYVDITIVCEGNYPVEKTYRINAVYDGDSSEIETIYSKLKEPAAPENVHPYVDNDVWSHDVHEDNIWMAVSTRKNNEWTDWQVSRVLGVSSFKSTAFIRTNNTPATPTGGSYESPLPTDKDENGNLLWSDGIPEGESILWASVCTFHSNGHYPEDAKWSTPRALTDTADFEAIYSPKEIHEEIPSGFFKDGVDLNPEWESAANAAGWYDDPNQWNVEGNAYKGKPTIWMATNTAKNGVWEGWKISRVLGEKGADAVSYEITPPSLNLRETLTGTVTPSATVFTCYASNKEERVETEATWGIKGRKDGQDDWTTFDYSHVGTTMTFEPNQHDRYDEYLITAVPKGQTTALEVQIISTKDRRGVMPRYCGRWKEGTKYFYNDEVRDIVTLGGNVFQVYPYNPNGYVEARPNPDLAEDSHDDYWEKANKFSFVAMDTALIDSAHIAGFTFWVDGQDAEGNPLGRMESANKKIVLDTVNETIKSTDAIIEGSITAGSMSYKVLQGNGGDNLDMTGYGMASGTGSYILPDIEEGKTLQVRALCANYSNEFVKFAFRVADGSGTRIYVKSDWSDSWGEVDKVALGYNKLYTFTSAYDNIQDRWVWILSEGMGANGTGQSLMIIDSEMSATSINPVQNKVIYEKFQSLGPFAYNKDLGYWTFNGDLLVQGGVTSHANEGRYTPSTIMDGVQVDGTTIIKDEYGNLAINPDIELGGNGGGGEKLTFTLNDGSTKVIYDGSTPKSIALTRLYKSTEVSEASSDDGAITPLVMRNWTSQRYVTAVGLNGDYLTWTLNGEVTKITVPYATTAKKLSTINKKAWGNTYWTSEGIPADVSGDMEDVGSISMDGQLCFNDAVAISSNDNAVVINPSKDSTTGQVILGVNGKETIFSSTGGVNVPNGNLTLGKLLICQTYKDFAYINQLKGVKNLLKDGDLFLNNIGYFVGSYSYDDSVVVGKTYKLTLCAKLGENSTALIAYWDGGSGNNTFVGGLSSKEERVVSITARITQINNAKKLAFYQQPNASPYGSYVKWAYLEEAFVASDFSSTSEYNQWLSSQKEEKSAVVMDNIEMIRFGNGNDSNNVSIYKVEDGLRVRGNLLVTGGVTSRNVTSSSDIRYKDVHKNLELSIDKMADAPNFEFHFIDDEEMRTHVGTSAQYWQDLEGVVSEDSDGRLGLDYSSLGVSMGISLARKLREALREIERLKEEINKLKRN